MKKRTRIIVSVVILCSLLVTGTLSCNWGLPVPSDGTPAATRVGPQVLEPTPPQVVSRTPARGEEQGVDSPIILVFDQAMDKASVEASFTVEPAVEGTFTWPDERTLHFIPAAAWERGIRYRVLLSTAVRSTAGLALEAEYAFRFSTVGYLEVAQVQPADGTDEVDMNAAVTVMFNRPVVPLTAISEQAALPQPLTFEPAVEGSGEWLNTAIYLFRPTEGFAPATTYTALVGAGLSDTTGGVLAEDYAWTFTTKLPAVVRTLPDDGDVFVGPSETITVTFNQPMNHSSAEARFSLTDAEGRTVDGMFAWATDEEDRELLVFTPARPLELDTVYRGRIARGALAAAGEGGTTQRYSWSFTTVGLPNIVRTDPRDGATRADPYAGLNVTFSSPMDPTTLEPNLAIEYYDTVAQESGVITHANVYTYWRYYDSELYLSFGARPSTQYTITFGADLTGRYGHKLGEPYSMRFTTRQLDPMAYVNVPGWVGTYDASSPDGPEIIVTYRNVSQVDFALYRLSREDFLRLSDYDARRHFRPNDRGLLRQWSEEVDAPLNQVALLPTAVTLGTGEWLAPGLYYLEVGAPEFEWEERTRHVMVVSTANALLKQTETGALVWATGLGSGDVLAQAPVVLYDEEGQVVAQGTTDDDGVFQAEFITQRDMWDDLIAVVGEEGDKEGPPGPLFAVVGNHWSDGISPWDFGLSAHFYSDPYQGYLYTDRPIYRPGQTVYFKGILRTDDDAYYGLPAGVEDVEVIISDSQGREVYNERLPVSEMGTVYGELQLDEEASLGDYNILAYLDDYSFFAYFQVAEYRKPEFQVSVETGRDAYVQGDVINVTAQATYYFGGPVANADVTWSVLSRNYFFPWDGPGYYDFIDYQWEQREGRYYGGYGYLITQGQGTTDDEGRFTFQVPADIAEEVVSQVFTIEVSVTDVNNQQTSNRTDTVVHKGLFYVGLAPRRYVGTAGQEQTVDILTVDWEQEPVPEVPLTVVFNKHEWFSVQKQEDDGRYRWTWEVKDTPVYTTTVTTDGLGKATASFVPEEGGSYKVVAIGRDERENEIRSSTYLWVSSREYVSWRQENHDRIELIADKKSYQVGDVAEILVPSPYQGQVRALVSVERGHLISHEVITLESNSDVLQIPITVDHIPNAYVSVFIVKGRDENEQLASFKIGCIALPVSTAEKALTVTISPDRDMSAGEHYGPRETVIYNIQTTDHEGQGVPAELSLSLVDLSVLALADSRQVSLLDFFYSERGLGVRTAAALVYSVDRLNEAVETR
ncbi:MAG: Ig-like domain-containing protein, partial [Chloroflexota bacterium]|nr:Ig-like domain-containing protein [Chloroflexota bacterium]